MLSISLPSKGAGAANYYVRHAEMEYYKGAGFHKGWWTGQGVNLLRLPELVHPDQLSNLLQGLSPDGRGKLVQNAQDPDRQCFWDLTFSAPKSVSVLWAMATADLRSEIERCHRSALVATLDYAEKTVGLTRRGKGGQTVEPAALTFAVYDHHTSRALDPQIHSHALLLNLGVREDGTTGSLWSYNLFKQKKDIGGHYINALEEELVQRLEVSIHREKSGFHIEGVPKDLCWAFSKRRAQITARLDELGINGAIAAKVAALDTRPDKQFVPLDDLFVSWQATAREMGWQDIPVTRVAKRVNQERANHQVEGEDSRQTERPDDSREHQENERFQPAPGSRGKRVGDASATHDLLAGDIHSGHLVQRLAMVHPLDKQFSSYRPQTRLLSSRSFRDIEDSKKPAPKKPVKWILSHEKFHTGSERERTRDEYWDALNPEIHPLGHRWGKVLGQANWWLFSINTQRKHPFSTALSPSMRKFSIPALRIGRGHHPYKDPPSRMSRPSFRERILEKAALAQHRILNGKPALLIAKALKELDKRRKPRFSKGSVELARRVRKALRAKQKKEARLERGWKLRLPKLFSAHSAISKRENTDEQKQKGQSIGRSQ